jgi:hypothetical protein
MGAWVFWSSRRTGSPVSSRVRTFCI